MDLYRHDDVTEDFCKPLCAKKIRELSKAANYFLLSMRERESVQPED